MSERVLTGGCLCSALRYEARGTPSYTGYCFCGDCRKASGSGFVPFMGFAAGQVTVTGQVLLHSLKLADGRVSDRNHCAACGSLVFGGKIGNAQGHTIYAGTLDDPTAFKPAIGIFLRDKPDWVVVPPGLTMFDGKPRG